MPDDEDGVVLSDDETMALGLLLASRALDAAEVVIWEDVPLLAQDGFDRLEETIAELANMLHRRLRSHEERTGTDAREIHGRVS